MPQYYPINEDAARRAKHANSYFDYVEGSATASYRKQVDEAAALAGRQKEKVDPMYHEKIDRLLDAYARRLAENINHGNEIAARVPSILIAGGSNFPVRAKEKQNAADDRNMAEYREIAGLLDKIRSTGMGGIRSDEDNALEKLRVRVAELEKRQEHMKAVNAFFRRRHTLDGCPDLDFEERNKLLASMAHDHRPEPVPFPSFQLSNNSANIRRYKARIAALENEAQRAESGEAQDIQGDGYVLTENSGIGRIQFIFDGKPDDAIRALLKSEGFRWAPSEGAWQRMLNDNGRRAAKRVMKELEPQPTMEVGHVLS